MSSIHFGRPMTLFQIIISIGAPILASYYSSVPIFGTFRFDSVVRSLDFSIPASISCTDPETEYKYVGDTISAKLLFGTVLLPVILLVSNSSCSGIRFWNIFVPTKILVTEITTSQDQSVKKVLRTTAAIYFRWEHNSLYQLPCQNWELVHINFLGVKHIIRF